MLLLAGFSHGNLRSAPPVPCLVQRYGGLSL